jgi:hypothetical protein
MFEVSRFAFHLRHGDICAFIGIPEIDPAGQQLIVSSNVASRSHTSRRNSRQCEYGQLSLRWHGDL